MAKNSFDGYIDAGGKYFSNLPNLPKGGKDFVVLVLPWAALILGAIGIISAISAFGLFSYFSPYVYVGGLDSFSKGVLSIVLEFVSSLFLLMAFSGLSKKKYKGWRFVYFSEVVVLISNIVVFSASGIIMALVVFYILYQVRAYYK